MVKVPSSPEPILPEFVDKRTQLLHDYGAMLAHWAEFELAIEVKIAKLTGLKSLDASIVLGGLAFGNKPKILYSLLHERGDETVAEIVRKVINHAKRNSLVHGLTGGEETTGNFAFFKREVGNTYTVKRLSFTAETFNDHFETLRVLVREALIAMGLSYDDIDEYEREARLYKPAPLDRQDPRPDGETDSPSAK